MEALMTRYVATVLSLIIAAPALVPADALAVTGDTRSIEIAERMIEAHGGMAKWQNAPSVSFTDELIPAGMPAGLKGTTTVEQGSRRVYIEYPSMNMRMGWDGEQAWSENWGVPYPPRFLAQLNYYFLNLPWLTMDPGVVLGPPGKEKLRDDPVEYISIRMEFEPGIGDTPDDYYVLYIHPENHLLKGCKYIVTYESLLPEDVASTPEHILLFDRYQTVEGLVVPVHYSIYELDNSAYATCPVENWSFSKPFDEAMAKVPAGAVLDTSTP
jgi:hypothetical protein